MKVMKFIEQSLTGLRKPAPAKVSILTVEEEMLTSHIIPYELQDEWEVRLRLGTRFYCKERNKRAATENAIDNIRHTLYGELEDDVRNLIQYAYGFDDEDFLNMCTNLLIKIRGEEE